MQLLGASKHFNFALFSHFPPSCASTGFLMPPISSHCLLTCLWRLSECPVNLLKLLKGSVILFQRLPALKSFQTLKTQSEPCQGWHLLLSGTSVFFLSKKAVKHPMSHLAVNWLPTSIRADSLPPLMFFLQRNHSSTQNTVWSMPGILISLSKAPVIIFQNVSEMPALKSNLLVQKKQSSIQNTV